MSQFIQLKLIKKGEGGEADDSLMFNNTNKLSSAVRYFKNDTYTKNLQRFNSQISTLHLN